ncbi:protegrin-2-like isoform X2 [Dromiciops gliroides]|uniref:protegrin-2-like isoform X2 n=1 Tax=Dromiciops gliroides TaxID=33562 RepID=UPI001CC4596E|nr:protegrin-2-like isoform X2 [Dromiciops gliroides]
MALRAKRIRMKKGWIMWLLSCLLLLLSLVTPAPPQTKSYRELVNQFIVHYSQESGSSNLFRLLVLNLQPGTNNDPSIPGHLNFTIMETVCPQTSRQNPDKCDFKENGLVKECYGTISLDATQPSLNASCGGMRKLNPGQVD